MTRKRVKRKPSGERIFVRKKRPIMYASHRDANIFAYYSWILQRFYQNYLESSSIDQSSVIAYRSLGKNNVHFAKDVFDFAQEKGNGTLLTFDVSGFFDNLNHCDLKRRWQQVIEQKKLPKDHYKIFSAITRYSYISRNGIEKFFGKVDKDKRRYGTVQELRSLIKSGTMLLSHNGQEKGIPQGTPISAVLSNIYMIDFDSEMSQEAKCRGALYRRYSDDIAIVCKNEDASYFKDLVDSQLRMNHLELSSTKSEESAFNFTNDGFSKSIQYLGIQFAGNKCFLRSATLANHKRKAIRRIQKEYDLACKNGWPKIRRKKIYNLYSNYEYRDKKSFQGKNFKRKQRFWDYLKNANDVFGNDDIQKQYRRHLAWLHKIIKKYQMKLDEFRKRKN